MVGEGVLDAVEHAPRTTGPVALRVEGLTRGRLPRDVSFEVRHGEILGLAGLVGSGRSETLRAIAGADRPTSGRDQPGRWSAARASAGPRDAVRAGIGLVPEDRKTQGLCLTQSLRTNLTLAMLPAFARLGWIDGARETAAAAGIRSQFAIRSESVDQRVDELSGGNQQKALLGRWLLRDPDVLLIDEPTRGIDVGAKRAVHAALRDLAARGKALVVVSSELPELMALCDRIAVLSDGRLVATFDRADFDEAAITAAAFSGYQGSACVSIARHSRLAHRIPRPDRGARRARAALRRDDRSLPHPADVHHARQPDSGADRDRGRADAGPDRRRHRPVGRLGAGAGLGGAGDRAGRMAPAAAARHRLRAWPSA